MEESGEGDAVKDALEEGDGDAVVGDGDAGEEGFADAGADNAGIGYAGTAVDDKAVRRQVFREVIAGGNVHLDGTHAFTQECRYLDAADVFRVRDMGAGFGYENSAAGF